MKNQMFKIGIFLCTLALTCTQTAFSLNVGELKVEVRRYVEDTANPRIKYTNDFIVDLINQGHREFINATWALIEQDVQTVVSGTSTYGLPADLFAIKMVRFRNASNIVSELTEVSEKSLIQSNPDYERQTGVPMQYFVRFSTASAAQLRMVLFPKPNVAGTAIVDYYAQADELTLDSDIPFSGYRILYAYHEALAFYALARLKILEGEPDEAVYYNNLYLSYVKAAIDRLGRMPNYNPGFGAATR